MSRTLVYAGRIAPRRYDLLCRECDGWGAVIGIMCRRCEGTGRNACVQCERWGDTVAVGDDGALCRECATDNGIEVG